MQFEIIPLAKWSTEIVEYDKAVFKVKAVNIFDLDHTDDFWIICKTIISGGAIKMIIDMDSLEFIDSSGITVLIKIAKFLRSHKGDVILLRVPPRIKSIFKPIKLERFINFYDTEDEAVNFFKVFV